MLDTKPRKSRLNMQAILGFLLGVVASLFWMFFAVFVGGTLGPRHTRMYAWFAALGFALFGFIAAQKGAIQLCALAWHSRLGSPFCCWLGTLLRFPIAVVHRWTGSHSPRAVSHLPKPRRAV